MQRAATKCIAVYTGIGLSLYTGEDLEQYKVSRETKSEARAEVEARMASASNLEPSKRELRRQILDGLKTLNEDLGKDEPMTEDQEKWLDNAGFYDAPSIQRLLQILKTVRSRNA